MLPKDKQLAFILIVITVFGCGVFYYYLVTKGIDVSNYQLVKIPTPTKQQEPVYENTVTVTSSAFKNNGKIPDKYTCKGLNINPQIIVSNLPATAKSITLIMEDPDAPYKVWTHWIVANIPVTNIAVAKPNTAVIPENSVPKLAVLGQNDWGKGEYSGPCPAVGQHQYVFKVYVVDVLLNVNGGAEKKDMLKELDGHVVGYGELMGTYSKE